MPLEIRELVIKATVSDADSANNGGGSARLQQDNSPSEALVNACVEKVLEILKEKSER